MEPLKEKHIITGGISMLNRIFKSLFIVKSEKTKGTEERKVTKGTTETINADFQKITAKKIATENGIEYISKAIGKKLHSKARNINQVYSLLLLV